MKRLGRKTVFAAVVLLMVGGAWAWYQSRSGKNEAVFQTAVVTRGDLAVTISATGTVEPEQVIDVGAQVAGKILSFGKDVEGKPVDYGSMIKQGTVLALIDDAVYATDVASARAQEQSGQAGVKRAEADLAQYQAKLDQAQRDWDRAQKIGPSEALSKTSFDAYLSAYETARANVAVGQAAILQAQATQAQARAAMDRAQRNLGYCTITAPVDGVIIDRRVNIGQTVVASLNAPSLFLIAKDLTRMQVWVAVNEADIGKIRPGIPVTFSVDAFPGETFQGAVGKVRLNASMTQNVVTYIVEIVTDNKNGRLLPYLTANVQFELAKAEKVLLVPNTALAFTPQPEQISPDFRPAPQKAAPVSSEAGGGAKPGSWSGKGKGGGKGAQGAPKQVWVVDGSYVRPIPVKAGETDGAVTAVEGEGLAEGLQVATGAAISTTTAQNAKSPFTPQLGGRGGPPPGR